MDEEEIYRRAQVRTPTETATRERVTGCLLLRHVATVTKRLVVVQTTDTILSTSWLQQQQQQQQQQLPLQPQQQEFLEKGLHDKNKMSVISVANDTLGWDAEVNDVHETDNNQKHNDDAPKQRQEQQHGNPNNSTTNRSSISVSLDNIDFLFETIEQEIRLVDRRNGNETSSSAATSDSTAIDDDNDDEMDDGLVVVMVESLVPLLMRHGWQRVIRFLHQILSTSSDVILWIPVWTETLTSWQLVQLEDSAKAVLWMRHGDLYVFQKPQQQQAGGGGGALTVKARRGIIPLEIRFNLDRQQWDLELLQQLEHSKESDRYHPDHEHEVKRSSKQQEQQQQLHSALPLLGVHQTAVGSRTNKPVLRLEDEGSHVNRKGGHLAQPSAPSRPNIYLQDDDPEYDDLDEEDPDDDLDL